MSVEISSLINKDIDIKNGKAMLAGTNTTVYQIAIWYKQSMTPEEIADKCHYNLANVYAALAYYHANKDEIEAQIESQSNEYSKLENLLKTGKANLFLAEIDKTDWSKRHPKTLVHLIKLALEMEAVSIAQKLSAKGSQLYPENIELKNFAHTLEKPTFTSKNQQSNIDLQANSKWIKENRQTYKGQWVALKDGLLLEASQSLKTLASKFTERKNIYFTKVY